MKRLIETIKQYSIVNDRKRILKNYYSKEMRKGKTYRASLVDRVIFCMILYVSLIVILYLKSDKLLLSFYLSSISFYFLLSSLSYIYNIIKNKKIAKIREGLKKDILLEKIYKLKHSEFKEYVKTLFEKYYKAEIMYDEFPIDLRCKINNQEYLMNCFKLDKDNKVYLKDINTLLKELKSSEIEEGIVVTNSFFTEDVKEVTNILTYDLEKIIEMIKKTDLYPKDMEIEDYIIENFIDNRENIKTHIKSFNLNKIIKLYIVSVVFHLFSYLVVYRVYYKIAALSTFIIATLLLAYKFSEYIIIKDSSSII